MSFKLPSLLRCRPTTAAATTRHGSSCRRPTPRYHQQHSSEPRRCSLDDWPQQPAAAAAACGRHATAPVAPAAAAMPAQPAHQLCQPSGGALAQQLAAAGSLQQLSIEVSSRCADSRDTYVHAAAVSRGCQPLQCSWMFQAAQLIEYSSNDLHLSFSHRVL